jgi:hypothetical protein
MQQLATVPLAALPAAAARFTATAAAWALPYCTWSAYVLHGLVCVVDVAMVWQQPMTDLCMQPRVNLSIIATCGLLVRVSQGRLARCSQG